MDVWLDPILAPAGQYDLVRIGRDNDGGYLVDARSVSATKRLIAFGMNNDWSCESEFRARNPVPVDIYDHTVQWKDFVTDAFSKLYRIDKPWLFRKRFKILTGYRAFFKGDVRHHRTAIGYDRPGAKSLATVIAELAGPSGDGLFLKVDIESWEYRILDQIIEHADRLEGLAIEFHDVDLHIQRLIDFVRRCPLNLCHIHGNNFSLADPNGIPMVLELSFSRYEPLTATRPVLPHELDQPNNSANGEFTLQFHPASSAAC